MLENEMYQSDDSLYRTRLRCITLMTCGLSEADCLHPNLQLLLRLSLEVICPPGVARFQSKHKLLTIDLSLGYFCSDKWNGFIKALLEDYNEIKNKKIGIYRKVKK